MSHYMESRELAEQAQRILDNRKKYLYAMIGIQIVLLLFAVWIALPSFAGGNGAFGVWSIFCMAIASAELWFGLKETMIKSRCLLRQITFGEEIILKDADGNVRRMISYNEVIRAEVVPMLGIIYANLPRLKGRRDKCRKMYYIVLHLGCVDVREGDYAFVYENNPDLVLMPYDLSAWQKLSQHISRERLKSIEEANELWRVQWHDAAAYPVMDESEFGE